MPRLRYSLLSIFLLTALVAVGLLFVQRHRAWTAAQSQFAELIQTKSSTEKDVQTVERLVARYPALARQSEALCFVAQHGDGALCRRFLDAGADPNASDSMFSISVLEWAVFSDRPGVVRELLDAGATKVERMSLPLGASSTTTLMHAAAQDGSWEICDALAEHGYDVNASDGLGRTPLHLAAECGRVAAARSLLQHGADGRANRQGRSPWEEAIRYQAMYAEGSPDRQKLDEIVELLRQHLGLEEGSLPLGAPR